MQNGLSRYIYLLLWIFALIAVPPALAQNVSAIKDIDWHPAGHDIAIIREDGSVESTGK